MYFSLTLTNNKRIPFNIDIRFKQITPYLKTFFWFNVNLIKLMGKTLWSFKEIWCDVTLRDLKTFQGHCTTFTQNLFSFELRD